MLFKHCLSANCFFQLLFFILSSGSVLFLLVFTSVLSNPLVDSCKQVSFQFAWIDTCVSYADIPAIAERFADCMENRTLFMLCFLGGENVFWTSRQDYMAGLLFSFSLSARMTWSKFFLFIMLICPLHACIFGFLSCSSPKSWTFCNSAPQLMLTLPWSHSGGVVLRLDI